MASIIWIDRQNLATAFEDVKQKTTWAKGMAEIMLFRIS